MQDLHIIIVEHWILKQYIFVNKLISNVFKHVSFELRGHGFKHVSFESDCQQLVQILHSSKSWPALEPELDDIESLRISFIFFLFKLHSKIFEHPCGYSCKRGPITRTKL